MQHTRPIVDVVEQRKLAQRRPIINRIRRRQRILYLQIHNLALVLAKRLRHHHRTIEHASDGPLVERGLVRRGRDPGVVKDVLATDVQERIGEVAVRHLHAVVEDPERCAEGLGDTGETTAGGGVGFEHDEGEAGLLGEGGRSAYFRVLERCVTGEREWKGAPKVVSQHLDMRLVRQVVGEHFLRDTFSSSSKVHETVVVEVPIVRLCVSVHRSVHYLPFLDIGRRQRKVHTVQQSTQTTYP